MQVSKKLPDIQTVVNAFESQSFTVELEHIRTLAPGRQVNGYTTMRVLSSDGKVQICVGSAQCSISDNFDKAIGTRVAFRRMMHDFMKRF